MPSQHPGKTLSEQYMQPNKLSQNKLARALGVPPRRINEIILGKRAISADTAIRLGIYFGNSACYWMHIQAEYDITLGRKKLGQRLHNIKSLYMDEISMKGIDSKNTASIHTQPIEQQRKNIKRRLMR